MLAEVTKTSFAGDKKIILGNLLGTMSLTKSVLPHMIERRSGHIVCVTALVLHMGRFNLGLSVLLAPFSMFSDKIMFLTCILQLVFDNWFLPSRWILEQGRPVAAGSGSVIHLNQITITIYTLKQYTTKQILKNCNLLNDHNKRQKSYILTAGILFAGPAEGSKYLISYLMQALLGNFLFWRTLLNSIIVKKCFKHKTVISSNSKGELPMPHPSPFHCPHKLLPVVICTGAGNW